MSAIGVSAARFDAVSKVKGEAQYPGDINLPNQAFMKILFARRAHARILRLDTSRAEALPGVLAVLTARDVPVNEYGLNTPDQPVLCGPGSDKKGADVVRFIGDQVALVIAESEEIADHARELIGVDAEDLPVVADPRLAMRPGAPLLHPDRESNVFCHDRVRKGDVEAAFARADIIVEGEYHTPAQEHAYLQPEAGLGYIDEEGRVSVIVAGQWTHEDQEQIAHALALPKERVRVIYPAIGGAFGGREDMSVQIVLALAALRLHERGIDRPVKIIWSREESIIGHHKRHPYFIRSRWGATRAGKVVAAEVELIADGGAYIYTSTKVLGNAVLLCTGCYEIPNVRVDGYGVYTNNIPTGAFRGFGGPQGLYAAEEQMNKLAERLGMDPVEIRMRNLLHEGSLLSVGTPLPPGVSMEQVLERCAREAGWRKGASGWQRPRALEPSDAARGAGEAASDDPLPAGGERGVPQRAAEGATADGGTTGATAPRGHLRRGIGIAMGMKNVGFSFGAPESCTATIELFGRSEIESLVLRHAGAEVGQGAHTVFAQMAAEAVGVPLERVRLIVSDTAQTGNSGSASASRLTWMAGNSIRGAAADALARWRKGERPAVGHYLYQAPPTSAYDPVDGHCMPNFTYGYVAEAVEVEVDTETGQVRLIRVICADDVGRAINPRLIEGQIEGAVVQAAGYAILENFVQTDGICRTPGLSTYLIPTVLDIPERVASVILEYPDPRGPFGARGMAEMPYLPLAPAICHAVREATGVWIDEFPLTPERVLAAIEGAR